MDVPGIQSGTRRGPMAMFLRAATRFAAIPYGIAVRYRNRRFDRGAKEIHHASVPVVSVGNITTGGTGKTPMVAWLAKYFRQQGVRVSIVSRGYGSDDTGINDEARELEERLPDVPHVQNPNRVEAARVVAEELDTELILLDDGFQHRRLHRDLDIVLVDAMNPFGYGHLLPRGLLREPMAGLARADAVVLTRGDRVEVSRREEIRRAIEQYSAGAIWAESVHEPSLLLSHGNDPLAIDWLAEKKVAVVCAIGNPDAFSKTITDCGGHIIERSTFPDHHRYDRQDIESLTELARKHPEIEAIVCTHKDLVKLKTDQIGGVPLRAVSIEIRFTSGEEALKQLLSKVPIDEKLT